MPQVTQFPEITRLNSGDKLYVIDEGTLSTQITAGNADQSLSKHRIVNVNCVQDLVNLDVTNIPDNTMVHVRSYYEDYADRGLGGGHFYWKAGAGDAVDSGRYFKANNSINGRWERLLNGADPNVMMWGAKGTAQRNNSIGYVFLPNQFDDTLAINRALSGARYGWASRLYFPATTYRITDSLLWSAQQTFLYGDGCINGTFLMMDTGIEKDFLVSYGYKALEAHNDNPSALTDPYDHQLTNDIPKIEKIAFYYGGSYHRDLYSSSYPLQNNTNSVITFTLPGETNLINEIWTEGGRYGIRVIGPQGPGLRLTNSTINSQGEAAISLEGPVFKHPYPNWPWYTGSGPGMATLDNCSTDYRGTNVTGYSWVKVHNGASPNITIKDLKVEGMYPSGIVNYQRIDGNSFGAITINGLNWNMTELAGDRFPIIYPNTVVSISPSPLNSGADGSTYVNLQNMVLFNVNEVIRDYILRNDTGAPYIVYPTVGRAGGLNQYQAQHLPVTHYGLRSHARHDSGVKEWNYKDTSYVLNNQPDELMVSFQPKFNSGWYRVIEGNLSSNDILNYNVSISNFYEIHKLNIFSDNASASADIRSVSATTANQNVVTRARLYKSSVPIDGNGNAYPSFLDIFVENSLLETALALYPESQSIRVHLERMNSPHGNYSNATNLLVPIFLGLSGVPYDGSSKYHEVDLTRQHDRSYGTQWGANRTIGSTLLQKDIHLFVTSSRDVRLYDAGATVTFAGGTASTNAQGKPIFTNNKLTNIILTNSGNGYTSAPTITISKARSDGQGLGAYASGEFSPGGGIIRVHVISGGSYYGAGPYYETDGVSITGVQDGSVTTTKILDSNVTTAKIANSNVTTAKIADSNVTYAKIATSAVSGTNIADNGISTSKIIDKAITAAKIDVTGLSKLITSDSVSSSVRRLIIQNNPSAPTGQVLITADEIVLKNPSGLSYLTNSPVINLNIDTAGLGGIDNSSKATSAWYGIWGIYNSGTNLVSGVLSRADGRNFNYQGISSSDATWGFGPVMPGTYTYKALIGQSVDLTLS